MWLLNLGPIYDMKVPFKRYVLIKHPMRFQNNRALPMIGIVLIWFLSIILSIPFASVAQTHTLSSLQPSLPWAVQNEEFQLFLGTKTTVNK